MPKILVPFILDHGSKDMPKIQMTLPWGIKGIPNVRGALNLKDGLHFLAQQMRDFEICTSQEDPLLGANKGRSSSKDASPLITCIAHWYAVSLANYLRFIALIDYTENHQLNAEDLTKPEHAESINKKCDEYVEKLIPEIILWRNKVGAHFAATDILFNRKDSAKNDNSSMLSASLHGIPIWIDGYYFMGDNQSTALNQIHHWSVTKIHENLAHRFWPDFTWQSEQM